MSIGTGKSFIGALITKSIYMFSTKKILVVCYTNHALDQFLEDLLNIGIPMSSVVRLGSKYNPKTEALSISKQKTNSRLGWVDRKIIDGLKVAAQLRIEHLQRVFTRFW